MKNKLYNATSILFSLLLMNGGLNKFLNYMPVPEGLPEALLADNVAIMEIEWLMPLVGFAEVLAALLILIPRTRIVGALVVFPVMVGVLFTHIFVAPSGLPIALVIWAVLLWILFENKNKLLALIEK